MLAALLAFCWPVHASNSCRTCHRLVVEPADCCMPELLLELTSVSAMSCRQPADGPQLAEPAPATGRQQRHHRGRVEGWPRHRRLQPRRCELYETALQTVCSIRSSARIRAIAAPSHYAKAVRGLQHVHVHAAAPTGSAEPPLLSGAVHFNFMCIMVQAWTWRRPHAPLGPSTPAPTAGGACRWRRCPTSTRCVFQCTCALRVLFVWTVCPGFGQAMFMLI